MRPNIKNSTFFIIGKGHFSEVFEGIATTGIKSKTRLSRKPKRVAIKMLNNKETTAYADFFKEAAIASKLKHENIVEFLGICLEQNSIILELMEGGQLRKYLKSNRNDLSLWDLVKISHDIVKGCVYLEKNKFVHRDLAARNCLLTSTNSISRKVYIYIILSL